MLRVRSIYKILLFLSVAFATNSSVAQDASRIYVEQTGWSLGVNMGLTDLWGDVGTKSMLDHYTNSKYTSRFSVMGGMYGRYTIHPALAIRMMMSAGTLYATDEWNYDKAVLSKYQGDDAFQRFARAQKSRSDIFETAVMLELVPFRRNPERMRAHKKGQPYLLAGIGAFHFTPYGVVGNGNKFREIYELHVEGDGFGTGFPPAYRLWQLCIPWGIGYKWDIGEHCNIGVEMIYRKTFTDYIDGVSGKYIDPAEYKKHLSPSDALAAQGIQDKTYLIKLQQPTKPGDLRGNASNNDAFSSLNFTFYYKVFSRTHEWWLRHRL